MLVPSECARHLVKGFEMCSIYAQVLTITCVTFRAVPCRAVPFRAVLLPLGRFFRQPAATPSGRLSIPYMNNMYRATEELDDEGRAQVG